jgi:hypothetical protein|tara:strand:+ start:472 stop:1098 length:627 start_codon:yes stop_codon:yes gene_type:complete
MNKIFKFKSLPKNNFFAPEWEYFIAETIAENINYSSLVNFLIIKEKKLLKLKGTGDGYTGLGLKSVTSRHKNYNLFNFKNKEIVKLKKNIFNFHKSFLKELSLKYSNIYIKGWFNILKKEEQIKPHIHDFSPDAYLGGHFCVKCKNTSTYYINPVNQINKPEIIESKNKIGKLTLFQNCIPHYTDIAKDERITIAFDLSLNRKDWVTL